MKIPAVFCGVQEGLPSRGIPSFELWTILTQVDKYRPGSTLSRATIESFGTIVPVPAQ